MSNNLAGEMLVGRVDFGESSQARSASYSAEDAMAVTIVRLYQEGDEARAEVAMLREERNILARAKAAVTEGVEQQNLPAGVSRKGCHERPEPSPHFIDTPKTYESDTPETCEAVERWQQGKINIFDEMARLERERDEAREQLRLANIDFFNTQAEIEAMTAKAAGWQNQAELNAKLLVDCREKAERYRLEANAMMAQRDEAQRKVAELQASQDDIEEYGTEEINAAVDLRHQLAKALCERDKAISVAERLVEYAHECLVKLQSWGQGYRRYEEEMDTIREDIAAYDMMKEEME